MTFYEILFIKRFQQKNSQMVRKILGMSPLWVKVRLSSWNFLFLQKIFDLQGNWCRRKILIFDRSQCMINHFPKKLHFSYFSQFSRNQKNWRNGKYKFKFLTVIACFVGPNFRNSFIKILGQTKGRFLLFSILFHFSKTLYSYNKMKKISQRNFLI